MKQTAVEWLFLMINNPNRDQEFANKLLEKAKEMEKEQIDKAHFEGFKDGFNDLGRIPNKYYNKTFKHER